MPPKTICIPLQYTSCMWHIRSKWTRNIFVSLTEAEYFSPLLKNKIMHSNIEIDECHRSSRVLQTLLFTPTIRLSDFFSVYFFVPRDTDAPMCTHIVVFIAVFHFFLTLFSLVSVFSSNPLPGTSSWLFVT